MTLSGSIDDDTGGGISMSGNTGGSTTFSGATKKLDTGSAGAFSSTGSGHTINFTNGGLDIDTTSGTGFNATGGGTVNVPGSNNTIDTTTTGTALNVANTTIGSNGLNFQRISAGRPSGSGPTNGIVLNNTGSSGGLTVTGGGNTSQGGDNSGGPIQNTTGHGISLNSTQSPSFTNLNIQSTGERDQRHPGLELHLREWDDQQLGQCARRVQHRLQRQRHAERQQPQRHALADEQRADQCLRSRPPRRGQRRHDLQRHDHQQHDHQHDQHRYLQGHGRPADRDRNYVDS